MLFRRIDQHVRDQNWFAVGIDFCIVVIGVFIGLQVANWNDARANAVREKVILADLLDDLKADQASLSSALDLVTLGMDAGNRLLIGAGYEPVQSISLPGQERLFLSANLVVEMPSAAGDNIRRDVWTYSTMRIYPSHNDATIESLIAADNSSIIQNASLVRDLLRYRTTWTGLEDAHVNTFRPFRNKLVFVGQEHGFSPLVPVDFDVLIRAVREDPALKGALSTMVGYTLSQKGFYERVQQDAEALVKRVETELAS